MPTTQQKKKKIRAKADKLWQQIVSHHKRCALCGSSNLVCGHHVILKAQSSYLRYDLNNCIPVCRECHFGIHKHMNLYTPDIIAYLGDGEYTRLIRDQQKRVSTTLGWYINKYNILEVMWKSMRFL